MKAYYPYYPSFELKDISWTWYSNFDVQLFIAPQYQSTGRTQGSDRAAERQANSSETKPIILMVQKFAFNCISCSSLIWDQINYLPRELQTAAK